VLSLQALLESRAREGLRLRMGRDLIASKGSASCLELQLKMSRLMQVRSSFAYDVRYKKW
jgi:hypothetical protein